MLSLRENSIQLIQVRIKWLSWVSGYWELECWVGATRRICAAGSRKRILVALADADARCAAGIAGKLGNVRYYDNLGGMLEQKDVRAAVIAAPSKVHAEAVEGAAGAGKHVF